MQLTPIVTLLAAVAIARGSPMNAPPHNQLQVDTRSVPELHKRTVQDGQATVYYQDGSVGACGQYNSDASEIVAVSVYWWDTSGPGYLCGLQVMITNSGGDGVGGQGTVVYATVEDVCEDCGEVDLDLSVGTWNALTDSSVEGVVDIEWVFCDGTDGC